MGLRVTGGLDVGRATAAVNTGAARGLVAAAETLKGLSVREAPVDRGELRNSARVGAPQPGPFGMEIELEFTADHAIPVHEGRRPGSFPPIDAVEDWARRHGIPPFLVARSIAQNGTRPTKFLERPLFEFAPAFVSQVGGMLRRVL